jgi:hypothetical protein
MHATLDRLRKRMELRIKHVYRMQPRGRVLLALSLARRLPKHG